jgi:hypothetical protein
MTQRSLNIGFGSTLASAILVALLSITPLVAQTARQTPARPRTPATPARNPLNVDLPHLNQPSARLRINPQ